MKKFILIFVILIGATMVASDGFDGSALYSEYYSGDTIPAPDNDKGQIEIKYDNGVPYIMAAFKTGTNMWVGNDFDTSSYGSTYPSIDKLRIYCNDAWPNTGFDGSYIAVYDNSDGIPGEMIWPISGEEQWIVPSDNGFQDFDIYWQTTTHKFVAAINPYNNYPDCDPFMVDSNITDLDHSWVASGSTWKKFAEDAEIQTIIKGYNNLMLRVIINPEVGIETSSFGAIKALYK